MKNTLEIQEMAQFDLKQADSMLVAMATIVVPKKQSEAFYMGFVSAINKFALISENTRLQLLCNGICRNQLDRSLAGHLLLSAADNLKQLSIAIDGENSKYLATGKKMSDQCSADVVASQIVPMIAKEDFSELEGKDDPEFAKGCFSGLAQACSWLQENQKGESTQPGKAMLATIAIIAAKRAVQQAA